MTSLTIPFASAFISFFLGENTISEIIESIMAKGAYEVAGAGHEKVMRALLWAG